MYVIKTNDNRFVKSKNNETYELCDNQDDSEKFLTYESAKEFLVEICLLNDFDTENIYEFKITKYKNKMKSKELKIKNTRINKTLSWFIDNLPEGAFIAGGCVRAIIEKSKPIDYDIFFTDFRDIQGTKDLLFNNGYKIIFSCPEGKLYTFIKPLTLIDKIFKGRQPIKVQLITEVQYKSIETCLQTFDITACKVAINKNYNIEYLHLLHIKDIIKKRLVIEYIEYPYATFYRLLKYVDKGYKMSEKALSDYISLMSGFDYDENPDKMLWRKYID